MAGGATAGGVTCVFNFFGGSSTLSRSADGGLTWTNPTVTSPPATYRKGGIAGDGGGRWIVQSGDNSSYVFFFSTDNGLTFNSTSTTNQPTAGNYFALGTANEFQVAAQETNARLAPGATAWDNTYTPPWVFSNSYPNAFRFLNGRYICATQQNSQQPIIETAPVGVTTAGGWTFVAQATQGATASGSGLIQAAPLAFDGANWITVSGTGTSAVISSTLAGLMTGASQALPQPGSNPVAGFTAALGYNGVLLVGVTDSANAAAMFRSTNGGVSWSPEVFSPPLGTAHVQEILVDTINNKYIALTDIGVYVTSTLPTITVSPHTATVPFGGSFLFTAVTQNPVSTPGVIWSINGIVNGNGTVGDITGTKVGAVIDGFYLAPQVPNRQTMVTLTAARADLPTITDSAVITLSGVVPPPPTSPPQNITAPAGVGGDQWGANGGGIVPAGTKPIAATLADASRQNNYQPIPTTVAPERGSVGEQISHAALDRVTPDSAIGFGGGTQG